MASTFPQTVDAPTSSHVTGDVVLAADVDALAFDVIAIENEIRTGTSIFNVKHYGASVGTGSDDSTAINAAASAANTYAIANGHATVLFPADSYIGANLIVYANVDYEGNGSYVTLPNGAAANSDVFHTNNFDTLSVGTGSTGTGLLWLPSSGVPSHFKVRNFHINGNRANNTSNGRHGLAVYGFGYLLENLQIYDCHGSDLWTEWGSTGEVYQSTGVSADGDDGARFEKLELGPCDAAYAAPSQNDYTHMGGAVTGVTNVTNPVITTSRAHMINAGQVVTMTSFAAPLTALNATWTVLAVSDATHFQITSGAPGVWSSGGFVQSHVYPTWAFLGPHDSWADGIVVYSNNAQVFGSRAILMGQNPGAGAAGSSLQNTHCYNRHDVQFDVTAGNIITAPTCQFEGASRINILMRTNGFNTIHGDCYAGRNEGTVVGNAGVTGLQIESTSGGNLVTLNMENLPQQGDPGGTYIFLGSNYNKLDINISHACSTISATPVTVAAGTPLTPNWLRINFHAFDGGSGVATGIIPGWVPAAGGTSTTDFYLYQPGTSIRVELGSTLFSGSGVPSSSQGVNGDFYFNVTGTVAAHTVMYHKESGSWVATAA